MRKRDGDLNRGNVVIGYCDTSLLMLDVDDHDKAYAIDFAKRYTDFHNLGSVEVYETSKNHFAVIFGKPLDRWEIRWHLKETLRLGVINEGFSRIRDCDGITIRTNAKDWKTPSPKSVYLYVHGDTTGILRYRQSKKMTEKLGML